MRRRPIPVEPTPVHRTPAGWTGRFLGSFDNDAGEGGNLRYDVYWRTEDGDEDRLGFCWENLSGSHLSFDAASVRKYAGESYTWTSWSGWRKAVELAARHNLLEPLKEAAT